ncbi:MAG: LamG domain-containing protein [Planctomycetales bacterium]|nr:LamG domain-containing protein [Planctomycetales bacterium]
MRRDVLVWICCWLPAASAIGARPAYEKAVLEDRPVAYWRFESKAEGSVENLGSRETEFDGRLVDVTLTPESASRALGQAAVFDRPNSHIKLAATISPWLNRTATLEFWIKTQQTGAGSWNAPAIFGADSNGDGNDLFWGTNFHGRIGVRRGDSGPAALSPAPLSDNHWHHVVLTRDHDTGTMQAFVDGRLVHTCPDAAGLPINTEYGAMGHVESLPGEGQKLLATLDEVAVYDRVLSAGRVRRHWKAAQLTAASHSSELPEQFAWIELAPLVNVDRDSRDAGWRVAGDTIEFSAGKPRAYVAFPVKLSGNYEVDTRLTLVRAKETTAIYLPVSDAKSVVLDVRGDAGNSESTTATISLRGLRSALEPLADARIQVGVEHAFNCRVTSSGEKVNVAVVLDDRKLFLWSGPLSEITGNAAFKPGAVELETAYYTVSKFRELRLRKLRRD